VGKGKIIYDKCGQSSQNVNDRYIILLKKSVSKIFVQAQAHTCYNM